MLAVGAVGAALVAAMAHHSSHVGVLAGALIPGLVAIAVGAGIVIDAPRRVLQMRLPSRLMAAGMLVWGIGQLLVALAAGIMNASYPTVGDGVTALALPLSVAGLIMAMRPSSVRTHWPRIALDAAQMTASVAMMVWRLAFRQVLFTEGVRLGDWMAVGFLLAELALVMLILLTWLRDLDRGVLLTLVGMSMFVLGDLLALHELVQGQPWPWTSGALWCLTFPVIGVGIRAFRPLVSDDDGVECETRVTVTTTLVSLSVLAISVTSLSEGTSSDPVAVGLAATALSVFALREVYNSKLRSRLLRTLTVHAAQDPLTGLGNRRAMSARLSRLIGEPTGAVLTLDLDGFKEVNDLLGHSQGDVLLRAVAQQISAAMPADCEAYRVGGDEFVIAVPGAPQRGQDVAETLLVAVRGAADTLEGMSAVSVSASVGVARWSATAVLDAQHAQEAALNILVESGVALHSAKESGRDRVEHYDGPVAARHRRSLDVERRLRTALDQRELRVHYQPVISIDDGRVVSLEALARWTDPVLGRVGPDEFIPVAERSGLIVELGTQVMDQALQDLMIFSQDLPGLQMAVNVSPVQLRSAGFADQVLRLMAHRGVDPSLVVVEVTESMFVSEDDVGIRHLHRLRRHGVGVAIDDFGSGYSALTYLSRLPASVLKVDQSLTSTVHGDRRSLAVLRAVVDLGRALHMQVTVEGIETQGVHDLVAGLGGCHGQGWLYSHAVPSDQVVDAVAQLDCRLAHGYGRPATAV